MAHTGLTESLSIRENLALPMHTLSVFDSSEMAEVLKISGLGSFMSLANLGNGITWDHLGSFNTNTVESSFLCKPCVHQIRPENHSPGVVSTVREKNYGHGFQLLNVNDPGAPV